MKIKIDKFLQIAKWIVLSINLIYILYILGYVFITCQGITNPTIESEGMLGYIKTCILDFLITGGIFTGVTVLQIIIYIIAKQQIGSAKWAVPIGVLEVIKFGGTMAYLSLLLTLNLDFTIRFTESLLLVVDVGILTLAILCDLVFLTLSIISKIKEDKN